MKRGIEPPSSPLSLPPNADSVWNQQHERICSPSSSYIRHYFLARFPSSFAFEPVRQRILRFLLPTSSPPNPTDYSFIDLVDVLPSSRSSTTTRSRYQSGGISRWVLQAGRVRSRRRVELVGRFGDRCSEPFRTGELASPSLPFDEVYVQVPIEREQGFLEVSA